MQIRAFEEGDTDEVVALWRLCGLTRPWNDPHREIARPATKGTGAGSTTWRCIRMLGAHGRTLMGEVEALLLARGCPKVNLQVRGDNAEALAFYANWRTELAFKIA